MHCVQGAMTKEIRAFNNGGDKKHRNKNICKAFVGKASILGAV